MNDAFWNGGGQPSNRIMYGRIGEENANHPGIYRFTSSDGFVVNDAYVLSSDADTSGRGQISKPTPGSYCVAVMSGNGAQCFIVGFQVPPKFDEEKDEMPVVGNPDENDSSGDKVFRTAGGAVLILKRGGAVIIEGGAGTGVIMNPLNNTMTLRAANFTHIADGYQGARGRKDIGKTSPQTFHREEFLHQVGPVFDRFRVQHGSVDGDVRRRLELASVTVVGSQETAILKTRESYKSDGGWIGEGPKYQWGGSGADEPGVLGNALVEVIGKLIDIIKNLKVGTAWGPSTPPIPPTPIELEQLKAELSDKILSTFLFLSKNKATLI